ncbi:uncharacterized protein [Littorina saxatilis]
MMTAVSETEKENPSLWGMGVVGVAIVVRFLHSLAQKEMSMMVMGAHPELTPAILTIILACVQVVAALSIFRVGGLDFSASPTNREAAIVGVLSYVGGMYLNNYLLWTEDSAGVACYAVMEPVLCMLLLFVAARIPTESQKACSVVCFCLGALMLTASFSIFGGVNSLLCVLGALCFLVRNLVTKHLYDSSVTFTPRSQNIIMIVVAVGTISMVLVAEILASDLLVASLMVVVAGVLSVTLLYLMFMLLSMYDTLTVAVFMMWSQVLENVVFVADSTRPGFVSVCLGAILFAAGHYFYFKDGLESGTVHLNIKQVGVNELFTRLQFILYTGCIVGLTAGLLHPFISERDISVLSYVGLDRIARKLLNVPTPHEH